MSRARTNADNVAGDISGVTASTGLSGGGTSATVSLAIDTAVTADLSTAQTLTNKTLTLPIIGNFVLGYTTTATAAGTTTLTNTSNNQQVFTGTTTQTVVMPVASTVTVGTRYVIENNSTGNVTVNSSGSNLIATVVPGSSIKATCILASGTTAASWDAEFIGFNTVTGTGSNVLATSPTLTTPIISSIVNTGTLTLPTSTDTLIGRATTDTLTNKTLTAPIIDLAINAQTGTTYTFVLADDGKFVTSSNAGAITVTIPPAASVAYATGAQLNIIQKGAGQVTFAAGSGVTIRSTGATAAAPKLRAQYSSATAIYEGSDVWYVIGDIA